MALGAERSIKGASCNGGERPLLSPTASPVWGLGGGGGRRPPSLRSGFGGLL
jgi:hypothetical protein